MTEQEEQKSERLQFSMTITDRERLEALAKANTGENLSYMIRVLISKAWGNPQLFGLIQPNT